MGNLQYGFDFMYGPPAKTVRAWRECPHLRIEIWGTQICYGLHLGHPPPNFVMG